MIRAAISILAIPLAACATLSPTTEDRLGVQCNADRVQPLVGREATPDVLDRAKTRSGARSVRVIKPGQAVTMDFRSDRLNLELDDVNTIKAARCG